MIETTLLVECRKILPEALCVGRQSEAGLMHRLGWKQLVDLNLDPGLFKLGRSIKLIKLIQRLPIFLLDFHTLNVVRTHFLDELFMFQTLVALLGAVIRFIKHLHMV